MGLHLPLIYNRAYKVVVSARTCCMQNYIILKITKNNSMYNSVEYDGILLPKNFMVIFE